MLSKQNALKAVVFEYVCVHGTCVGERCIWYVCVCVRYGVWGSYVVCEWVGYILVCVV